MKRINESVESYKALRENRARLIAEEIKKSEAEKAKLLAILAENGINITSD